MTLKGLVVPAVRIVSHLTIKTSKSRRSWAMAIKRLGIVLKYVHVGCRIHVECKGNRSKNKMLTVESIATKEAV
jgi:hypothetical protein